MTQDELKKIEPFWDSWYIDECIGHGSFGDVYRIKREGHGRVFYSAGVQLKRLTNVMMKY